MRKSVKRGKTVRLSAFQEPSRGWAFESKGLICGADFTPVCSAIFGGALFLWLLTLVISSIYHPDSSALLAEAKSLVMPWAVQNLAPEPVERLQFLASLVLLPPFLMGWMAVSTRFIQRLNEVTRRYLDRCVLALFAVASLVAPFLIYIALKHSENGFLYVRSSALYTHPLVYTIFVFPLCLCIAWGRVQRRLVLVGQVVLWACSLWSLVVVFSLAAFQRESISPWVSHLNPVIYPLAQVLAGKTLLVDCASLYGLYPHLIQPLFKIVPLTVHSFTLLMAVLVVTGFLSLLVFLRSNTRSSILGLAGFLAVVFFSLIGPRYIFGPTRPDPYFQYYPIRLIFPCAFLLLASLYIRGCGGRKLYWIVFALASVGILWNPDSGVVVFCAWLLLLGYLELFRNRVRDAVRRIALHAIVSGAFLALAFGGYSLFAFLRSGIWPDWQMTARYYKLFTHYGYGMLPMPSTLHFWQVIMGVCLVTMAVSLHGLLKKKDERFSALLFVLTVMEAGLFGYYQGRSHDYCLVFMLYLPIVMLTLLADRILEEIQAGNALFYKYTPSVVLILYFLFAATPSVIVEGRVLARWIGEGTADALGTISADSPQGMQARHLNFLKKHTVPGEKVFILLDGFARGFVDGLYYAESGTASAVNVSAANDWFFQADVADVIRFLQENRTTKVFVRLGEYRDLSPLFDSAYRVVARDDQTGLGLLLPVGGL